MEIEYRELPYFGLSVSKDGKFKRDGKPIKVRGYNEVGGYRRTVHIIVAKDKKRYRFNAARLVAKAWCDGYSEDKELMFKDGDCHNISAENLVCIKPFAYKMLMAGKRGMKKETIDVKRKKLQGIILESKLTLDYYDTGDFTAINKHLENDIIPLLEKYCMCNMRLGRKRTTMMVSEVLSELYEKIDNGCAMYCYEWWCKLQIRKLVRNGMGRT